MGSKSAVAAQGIEVWEAVAPLLSLPSRPIPRPVRSLHSLCYLSWPHWPNHWNLANE